jgi:hypothetical protein
MVRFKIYHIRTDWVRNNMRNDRAYQKKCGEVYKEEKYPSKIYKSKKPPRRRVHTCSVEYDRVQVGKSVHCQYVHSKEARCKVVSEKFSWEKPKSHRTKKSGKIVNCSSVNKREKRLPGMMSKCKNFSNVKYGNFNVKTTCVVTLRKFKKIANCSSVNNREKRLSGMVVKCKNFSNAKYGTLNGKTIGVITVRKLIRWKNCGVTLLTGNNLIVNLKVFRINSVVNVVNLKNGSWKPDCEKGYKCKKGMLLNFRKIVDICILLKEQEPECGVRFKGTVAQESRRRFWLYNCEQKGMVSGEIYHVNHTGEYFTTNDV